MELPDCPPGAEGYQDSVTEVPKKLEDNSCTKAEQEFQDHLNSLKIKIEDGSCRCMVERRGRDVSGKWIYLCYPCAAVCSGEAILQTHISGKKHKTKLAMRNIWPLSIFSSHPYNQNENANKIAASSTVLKKIAEEVELYHKSSSDMDQKYGRLKDVRCHIQDTLDEVTAPLIGVEYLVEHPPLEAHYEPSYTCTLCFKQGHPRTIVNHMTCFWHRHNYLQRHFTKAADLLKPFRQQIKYRDGVAFIMNRIAQRIVEKYGRMKPINIDKEDYEKEKERIHQWIFKGPHYCETKSCTFEEVVDIDLINTLYKSSAQRSGFRDISPPIVPVPKPNLDRTRGRSEERMSVESLSHCSDDLERFGSRSPKGNRGTRVNQIQSQNSRHEPYTNRERDAISLRAKFVAKNVQPKTVESAKRQPNHEYKLQVAAERRKVVEDAASKSLAYHEKNPEKHPLYPEEWKKFWNRRYKEIQTEGKDPSKHDFKPEWIVFWTGRMKELHKEEMRLQVVEIYRKMCLTPPSARSSPPADTRRKSPDTRRKSPDGKDAGRRSPEHRKRSAEPRRRTPPSYRPGLELRRRSPFYRQDYRSSYSHHRSRYSPVRVMRSRSRSPVRGLRSPPRTHNILDSRDSRSPLSRRETSHRNRSPFPRMRSPGTRLRSPVPRNRSPNSHRTRSPVPRLRSPVHRKRSPTTRNRSPAPRPRSPQYSRTEGSRHGTTRNRSPISSALNTVLISDDDLKPEDVTSPWNSDNSLESLGSLPDARSLPSPPRIRADSMPLRHGPAGTGGCGGGVSAGTSGGADNVVATLRTLVALEDYLGSLGPKVVDLLAEAIRMEKDKANSSEELLERETALVLIETAKEKLKGAAQAGLVAPAAAAAVRAAVVRAAATLHEADKRAQKLKAENSKKARLEVEASVPVAGVGAVDRVQIAQQMAAVLVAQGKTDVSEEELAQLVDAVVGMAEAKKREADEKKQASSRSVSVKPSVSTSLSGTASALQMLQSAYDDKKCEKEDLPDAMDGLSDSDLETLLKNFNELSAEEQHSLIAYLKKLEAREPQRVERLRQYVSAAAAYAPTGAPAHASSRSVAPSASRNTQPVPIESDDDDYTVEEVFKSATEKVKEDKIRQEMEIVKKSLEESNLTVKGSYASEISTNNDLANSLSSAASLLALVQATLQSANRPVQAAIPPVGDVVTSNTQPRPVGDKQENLNQKPVIPSNASQPNYADHSQNQPLYKQQGLMQVSQNIPYPANTTNTLNETRLGGNNPNKNNESLFGANNPNAQKERFGEKNSNLHSEQVFGVNNPNMVNDLRVGANNPNTHNEPNYGGNNPSAQSEPRFGAKNNPNTHNEQSYGGNKPSAHSEPRFGANNPNTHNEQSYGGNKPGAHNEPRFGANNANTHNEQIYAGNNPSAHKEPRFDANNPSSHNEQSYGGNKPNANNEPRFGANNPSTHNEQSYGGNKPNTHNEARFGANNPSTHNEQSYGGNKPNTHNEPRFGANNPSTHNEQSYGGNKPNTHNDPRLGANNPSALNEQSYGGNKPNANNEPRFGANNPSTHNEQSYGGNKPNTHNDPRFGANNPSAPNEQSYGGNKPNANNEPRFGANNPSTHNEQSYAGNKPITHNERRFGANNPNTHNEQSYGVNKPNAHNEPPFGVNNPNTHNEQSYGGNKPSAHNEPRFVANNLNTHNEPRFSGNNPDVQNKASYRGNNHSTHIELRFRGNNPRMHKEPHFGGGNTNTYNEPPPYNPPAWERRQMPNMSMAPPRDPGFNNYLQNSSFNQGDRGPQDMYNQRPPVGGFNNINSGRMQENYDARTQNTHVPKYNNPINHRGRGGGMGNFGNRGRGRGRGAW